MARKKEVVTIPTWWQNKDTLLGVVMFAADTLQKGAKEISDIALNPHKYESIYREYVETNNEFIMPKEHTKFEFLDSRFYNIGGTWVPSATTILWAYPSPGLTAFIGSVGTEQAELRKIIGGERGSKVHDALQNNKKISRHMFTDEEWLLLIRAKLFLAAYNPKTILNEEPVWDIETGYACRLDRVVRMTSKNTLIDWKTGHVGREAWLQLAANKNAIEKTKPGLKIESYGIVALNASVDAGWKYYPAEETKMAKDLIKGGMTPEEAFNAVYLNDFEVFKHTLAVWHDAFRNVKPRSYPVPPPDELDLFAPLYDPSADATLVVEVKAEPAIVAEPAEVKENAQATPAEQPATQLLGTETTAPIPAKRTRKKKEVV